MSELTKILRQYSTGEKTLEEVNAELRSKGYSLQLDPTNSYITPEEHAAGWGWLDTGTGPCNKCKADLDSMELVYDDQGESFALFIHGDDTYEVKGKKLVLNN